MRSTKRWALGALAGILLATVAAPAQGTAGEGGATTTSATAVATDDEGGGGDKAGKSKGGSKLPNPNPSAQVSCEHRGKGLPRFCVATAGVVTSSGLTPDQAGTLAAAFGLEEELAAGDASVDDGVFRFIDRERFQSVPSITIDLPVGLPGDGDDPATSNERITSHQVLDVPALVQAIQAGPAVLGDQAALDLVAGSLGDLLPPGAAATVTNTKLQLAHNPDSALPANPAIGSTAELLLDTVVSYTTMLGGVPVVGPGSKIQVTLDPEGAVTQLQYAARGIGRGQQVEILDPALAPGVCRATLGLEPGSPVGARLVYYAPALGDDVEPAALLPHFECTAAEDAEGELPLGQFVPAVVDAPSATITDVAVDGTTVTATGAATGGTPPYTYSWSSAATVADQPAPGRTTAYDVVPREPGDVEETLVLTVRDANGLGAVDIARLMVAGDATPGPGSGDGDGDGGSAAGDVTGAASGLLAPRPMSHGYSGAIEVGGEGGTSSPDCAPYVNAWRDWNKADGVPSQFTYLTAAAWSTDFQKPGIGQDHHYADDVDALFYCGHGFKGGFTFENTSGPADKDVTPGEMALGDWDLEWLFLLSCQVMRESWTGSSWTATWAPSFTGMHGMYGFHTNAHASGNLGRDIARYMLGVGVAAKRVHEAFVQAAIDSQPSTNQYGILYPVSTSYSWNRNDWFWGEGEGPGADIPASQIYYWARFQGAT
jgi:hypothetical protein